MASNYSIKIVMNCVVQVLLTWLRIDGIKRMRVEDRNGDIAVQRERGTWLHVIQQPLRASCGGDWKRYY